MKALVPTRDPERLVELSDCDEPAPASNEALIAVSAFSVNRGETFLLEKPHPGWRPGKDVAGTVVRPAADGSGPAEGTRVVAHPPASGWAERIAVSTRQIAELPAKVETTIAAALPLAGLTALRLLRAAGSVSSRRLLMTGASGGVGHYFAELAAMAGADLTAVTASEERGARLLSLGARSAVRAALDADGRFDVVFESVGGSSLQDTLLKLAPRGTLIWFGQASRSPASIDFFRFWDGPASGLIRHFDYTDSDIPDGRDLGTLVDLVAQDRLHPELGLVADWAETASVLRRLRERGIRGNAVMTL